MSEKQILSRIEYLKSAHIKYGELEKCSEDLSNRQEDFSEDVSDGSRYYQSIAEYIEYELRKLRLELCEIRGE